MARILVIDDEHMVRTMLAEVARAMGHEAAVFASLAEGVSYARVTPCDVVYLDVLLPDGNGLDTIQTLRLAPSSPEIIVITGYGSPDGAELAVRHGVWEYLQKPLTVDQITLSLSRVLAFRQQKSGNGMHLNRPDIIGNSPTLLSALDLAAEAASTNVNVLLLGETGTGKELFAKAIHHNSARAGGPLITLDCASFTESLLESQLFGHKKGAFTGADRARDGLLAMAHGGTLVLDEIGDLPLHIQGAFLRVLETRRFRPIGATQEVESDFRLIASTNKDLHEMVRLDMFRADLLYRLRGLTITLPSLRDRKEDLPDLVEHYLAVLCTRYELCAKGVSEDFMETVRQYNWPGNVRELFHALDRACTASQGEPLLFARQLPTEIRVQMARTQAERRHCSTLPSLETEEAAPEETVHHEARTLRCADIPVGSSALPTLKMFRMESEARYLKDVLAQAQGNIRQAVSITGLSRGHLYELLKKHELTG